MGLLYGWSLLEKNKRPVIIPEACCKVKLHGCQKAINPPPRIRCDRGTKTKYDLIMQQANSLGHRKKPKAGR